MKLGLLHVSGKGCEVFGVLRGIVLQNLGSAATAFSCHEYVGCTVIRPRPGSTIFTVILRFTSKKALEVRRSSIL